MCSATSASAMVKTPSPKDETLWPVHRSAKSRTLKVSKVLVGFFEFDTVTHNVIAA
jgi:hypothetical protein